MTASSPVQARPFESTIGYLNFAKSYLEAGRFLIKSIQSGKLRLAFDDPVSQILGQGLELTLKACLRHKVGRFELTHDLAKLRTDAIRHGCKSELTARELDHFQLLNGAFGMAPYETRYLKTGSMTAHDDTILMAIADRFALEATDLIPGAKR